jgi:hypothetical protein
MTERRAFIASQPAGDFGWFFYGYAWAWRFS